jgi:hypothetical protein
VNDNSSPLSLSLFLQQWGLTNDDKRSKKGNQQQHTHTILPSSIVITYTTKVISHLFLTCHHEEAKVDAATCRKDIFEFLAMNVVE